MIVRETKDYFILTTQHDHAELSGKLAENFVDELFINDRYKNDTIAAIHEHDRAWIRLDHTPIMNDRDAIPYSFMDYPILPKLVLYGVGVDEVEESNKYAALLCSLHYSSFKAIQESSLIDCVNYLAAESKRQAGLKAALNFPEERLITQHFKLLQLCDEMSLYVCMNHPGAPKEDEHPWYKNGFGTVLDRGKINAQWKNEKEILVSPFLFKQDFAAILKCKHVSKILVQEIGINDAYHQTEWTNQEVRFVAN